MRFHAVAAPPYVGSRPPPLLRAAFAASIAADADARSLAPGRRRVHGGGKSDSAHVSLICACELEFFGVACARAGFSVRRRREAAAASVRHCGRHYGSGEGVHESRKASLIHAACP